MKEELVLKDTKKAEWTVLKKSKNASIVRVVQVIFFASWFIYSLAFRFGWRRAHRTETVREIPTGDGEGEPVDWAAADQPERL